MIEIDFKITELSDDIQVIENECCRLVNYGNVPKENWSKLYELLQRRMRKKEALEELLDLKATIESNIKQL